MRTQVGIVGAGPAGLMLSHLLHLEGIESVILENRNREYIESRIRAGLIEQWASDLLVETGVGARMQREGMFHNGVYFAFGGALHYINFRDLVGKGVTIYGQQEVVKDLIAARLAAGGALLFEAEATGIDDVTGDKPTIRFKHNGQEQTLTCDIVAGCDGFHGVCRGAIPDGVLTIYDREFPFGWLGIMSESPPIEEMTYVNHDRGFALASRRSPHVTRLYVQCALDDDIANWPDARIWDELHIRLGDENRTELKEGRIFQKGITPCRSFVAAPMRYGCRRPAPRASTSRSPTCACCRAR
jgi:p-hydroxybenzoate 3-monooxygenase